MKMLLSRSRSLLGAVSAALLLAAPAASRAEAPKTVPGLGAAAGAQIGKTTLWKVKGAKNTVYLLGTIHILRPEDHPLPAAMDAAYADSKVMVMEINSADMNSPEIATLSMEKGMYQDGSTLNQHVKPETYALFEKRATAAGLPPAMYSSMKPWLATVSLVMVELMKSGYDPTKGVDKHYEAKALADGKPVEAFESAKFQLTMMDQISTKFADEMIGQTIKEMDTLTTMLGDMIAAWKAGDEAKLENTVLKSFKEFPEVEKALLTDRNTDWVKKLDADYLKRSENVLVTVGAAHLIGANSVVDQLKKKGYAVEQK
jgi:uncharacterized protein YbaP (TraB family)